MKRSESVLTYGVAGILLVILAVAVIFGSESNAVEKDQVAKVDDNKSAGIFPEELTAKPGDEKSEAGATDGSGDLSKSDANPSGAGLDPSMLQPAVVPGAGLEAGSRLGGPQVPLKFGDSRIERTALGESEVINQGELNYRYITVRRNDSFRLLVQRWTGSATEQNIRDVRALNEELRVDPLSVGTRICMPYVSDDELLGAMEDRRRARANRPVSEPESSAVGPLSKSVPSSSAVARTVILKKGESLWTIAAREVGRGKADAYIKRICALNGIDDPGRVQAKQKIKLPPKKAE